MSRSSFEGFPQPKKDSGGTKTGDATATAGDLGTGKTAYAVGVKIVGNGANFGNAAVGDVSSGTTFSSANGTLITGTGANAKRYATGNATILTPYNRLTVSGLSFTPKFVIAYCTNPDTANLRASLTTAIMPAEIPWLNGSIVNLNAFAAIMDSANTGGATNYNTGESIMNSGTFTIPVRGTSVTNSFKWYAFE